MLLTIDINDEPISYEEVFKHAHWQKAIAKEISSDESNEHILE